MSDSSMRIEELLVEQTDRDLTYQETAEVQQLLRQLPDWNEDDIELAAAASFVAIAASKKAQLTAMPGSLREKISQQAQAHFLLEEDERRAPQERSDTLKRPVAPPPEKSEAEGAKVVSIFSRTKILLAVFATAAAIGIAMFSYWYLVKRAELPPSSVQRQSLIASAKDAVTIPWSAAGDPLGQATNGDVVWSDKEQAGFMRFVGLPKNDKTKIQYQLWIFDADRDDRYPVDGGVFDVNEETGEVIVRIDPKIRVNKATMFAVTVERPGGVVVSTRERLVVLAKVI